MKKIDKKNPFKTPEGYFDEFHEKLVERLSDDKVVIPDKDGFKMPEKYLEGLHKNISQKLDKKDVKVISLKPFRKYYYVAASIAAVAFVVLGLNWNPSEKFGFEDLANTEIETYFEDNELGLNTYEIAEVLPIDELEIIDILDTQFKEEKVLDYLNENLDDFEELNLEEYE